MKILCLHGSGTSAQIFKTQLAAIRHELGGQHTYEFVQGTVEWPLAPGLEAMASAHAKYWIYFDLESLESYKKALDDLDSYIAAEGPFDAVMGFSNGAHMAAMHMARSEMRNPHAEPPFKCAILFNAARIVDPLALFEKNTMRYLSAESDGEIIKVPVVNIWGEHDYQKVESDQVSRLCQASLRSILIHDSGHEVPGLGARSAVIPSVKLIRRALMQAASHVQKR